MWVGTFSSSRDPVTVKSSSQYCATKHSSGTNEAYTGCTAYADYEDGGPIDPGFAGTRRLKDGSCEAQTWY